MIIIQLRSKLGAVAGAIVVVLFLFMAILSGHDSSDADMQTKAICSRSCMAASSFDLVSFHRAEKNALP